MNLDLLAANLLSPPVLFFALGVGATLLKSDLAIPDQIQKLFGLYLLWAIGYKGGVKLNAAGLDAATLMPLGAAVVLSTLTPLWVAPLLARRLKSPDACACAAAFGSVSAVTFITAANFLESQQIAYGGQMVAALALMEAPAIIVAVMLYNRAARREASNGGPANHGFGELLREALLSGPVFLLLGSLAVGLLAGKNGYDKLQPFTDDVFYGVLVLFLLDAGMVAAVRIRELGTVGKFAFAASVGIPLINAAIALGIAAGFGLTQGDGFLLMILAASASYIAVPATMKMAIPTANPGLYLPMALGITFPFNIALGIPLYIWAAGAVLGGGSG